FRSRLLPLYSGPEVEIRIGNGPVFRVSEKLFSNKSTYFRSMFGGSFVESATHSAVMSEIEGCVSVNSFRLLVQWIYIGRVEFEVLRSPEAMISRAIEFARLASMCDVRGVERHAADRIVEVIKQFPAPNTSFGVRSPNANTFHLTHQHIEWATQLPKGHPVRGVLAAASVEGYMRQKEFRFYDEVTSNGSFAMDVLEELRNVLMQHGDMVYTDPFTSNVFRLLSD
ncbi:hypothetical protein BO71DRAFT_340026, partial [Aspergillus ellipticus CBS 707.79]